VKVESNLKKVLGIIIVIAVLTAAGTAAWAWYSIERPYQGFSYSGVFVELPHGASSRTVARLLKQNGVIRSSFAFELYARRHPKRRLQAGEYFFDHAISGHDVFWQIADGRVYEQPFTVREGETIFDIAHDLETEKVMSSDEFLTAAQNPDLIRDIAPHAKTLEGFLFPATYFMPRHPVASDVTAEMVRKFKEEWQRTLVAGAFANRLRKHIPLQCDPTVIYAMQDAGQYNGKLTGADLHFPSPYNTYVHPGLPPGPIGNPGEASLRAALDPAQTNYIYFVANTQGGHFFAATLVEHNRNVTRYRRLLAGLPADPPEGYPAPAPAAAKPTAKSHRKHTVATKKSQSKHKTRDRQQKVASQ
jgi:UPF0755 protein